MLKNFLFTALLLNVIATYLAYRAWKKTNDSLPFYIICTGSLFSFLMIGLTIDLFFNASPFLFHAPALLWLILLIGIVLEIFSLYKKVIPGQLIAASLFLFLVMPTIFSFGIFLLIMSIIILIIAFVMFQKTKEIGF